MKAEEVELEEEEGRHQVASVYCSQIDHSTAEDRSSCMSEC